MGIDAEMLVRTKEKVTKEQVRQWAYEVAEAFGSDRFWVFQPGGSDKGQHALEIVSEYRQDGPTVHPEAGETFIRVYPATRYYGEGYERGDLPFLIMLAEYLERRIPGARIFYGGDSSGVVAEPFHSAARESLFRHFITVGHRPYRSAFSSAGPGCDFCGVPTVSAGGGRSRAFWECSGCGQQAVTKLGETGVRWLKEGESFIQLGASGS